METMTAEQAIEAAKGLTFEKVWAMQMEDRRKMDELRQRMDESWQRMEKNIADLSKNIGGLGNSLGDFIETMFSAEMMRKFDELGYQFNTQSKRKLFYNGRQFLAEVDSVLENGEYVMLVEIKTTLKTDDVERHLERIETVRQYMDARGDVRKLVGTVAGGIVPENVLVYAQSNGLYVLAQTGDSVAVADMPQGFKAQEW